ncbi:bifunctional aminotransferase class I/II-fold pyridoxal phosphate-dependent enzyme/GNAT family N-acetyltransferase [Echinicola shivajiensis]|uniref:bifunctional aminotransferase class I/II-fold pyridoxal phosphate-dependent enzyme/GNAT family N-acetyltransferase n=1 Tax=Echinicola shivajiensis TaxID=1035916 RepID=UPI001BFC70CC|nr:bifunctional aminotransferase class I/II-fold pyridoxal phosphate-dependent enzyme/GNAT family N-acetyltransferase [Echinicola shivajiensis]
MLEILNEIVQDGVDRGVLQKSTNDDKLSSSNITIQNDNLINFGSCSYLGLEFHPQLVEGVKKALDNYGTQFSTSRTYLSLGLYDELETRLEQIFQKPVIASASTSLGHLACLPVIVEDGDAVILDLQVHSSVQMTAQILKSRKIPLYIIPHNSMEGLESKIKSLTNKHKRIWYLADGVYSMYGDFAPLKELEKLLNKYKQFHLYIDDAHGMSWTGKNGCGYVRSVIEHHDKMILATSLNKSFASSGGALIFPNESWKKKVKNCGSTMIFSGPIQPPMLGAAISSAHLHLTEEFDQIQQELKYKIDYTNKRLKELDLPQYKPTPSPLFFIPVGLPRVSLCIVKRMKKRGFYLNGAGFPAVPMKKGGIRFMINNNLSIAEIEDMLVALQEEYILGLHEEQSSPIAVAKEFKLPPFLTNHPFNLKKANTGHHLIEEHFQSTAELDPEEWDSLFANFGSNTHHNLETFEKLFRENELKENDWKINYQIIRDDDGEIILATPYTVALMMDDLLADKSISEKVKDKRLEDPYFLTSKTLVSGTPFTKGRSIYINFKHDYWKEALKIHIQFLQEVAEKEEVSKIVLREFDSEHSTRLKAYLLEFGFINIQLPNNCLVNNMDWNTPNELAMKLHQKYRYSLRKEILKLEDKFKVEFRKPCNKKEIETAYQLYSNVHAQATDISVFKLPYSLFEQMCMDESYDIIRLYLREEPDHPVAVMFSQVINKSYNALIVGLDYSLVREHNTYKQILYQTVLRAKSLGCEKVDLAYTAEMEKKKVGAITEPTFAFTMAMEHYSHAIMESLK